MKSIPDNFLSAATSDPALTELCDEIIERLQAGDRVDMASLALEHPEYADQLRRLLPALEALVNLGASAVQNPTRVVSKQGSSDLAPKVLGDYRVLREIGRGGMGVVYEAEQRSLNRRVALKVLPMAAALDVRQFQRFQLEAQAAACLHHNNIVPVFAVGTEGGVPFYAMQYIEGRSLAELIQELRRAEGLDREPLAPEPGVTPRLADLSTTALARSLVSGQATAPKADAPTEAEAEAECPLPPGEGARRAGEGLLPGAGRPTKTASSTRTRDYCRNIAGLGLQAAEALDHAHTRGILHRDIKPANLLLDAEGRLWVTDFGLAQIQGNHGLTLSGDILGTLRYMSPEQALARRVVIDGRTDVYSLGVTLYELLTLQPAFDGKDRAEILRKIASDEPTPLRKLNASVPQDLETIIHKALAKEPSERYASAKELADDLRNYLEARPIRARRPSLLDRAAKWGRRHTASVAAASVILVLALIGLAASTILIAREQRRTAAALTQADARFQFARKAVDEMYTQFAEKWIAQQPKLIGVQREFVEKALACYEQFAAERSGDPQARFDAARALVRVGRIQRKLGRDNLAKDAFERALAQYEILAALAQGRAEYQQEHARCLVDLGGLYLHGLVGPGNGEPYFRRSLAIAEALVARSPLDLDARRVLAVSLRALGLFYEITRRFSDAERTERRCREVLEGLIADAPQDRRSRELLVHVENDLGLVYDNSGRPTEAEKALRRSAVMAEALMAEAPTAPDARMNLVFTLINVATVYATSGQLKEAAVADRRAEALLEALVKDFPEVNLEYRGLRLRCLDNQLITFAALDQLAEMEQVCRRAGALVDSLAPDDLAHREVREQAVFILATIADLHSLPPDGPLLDPAFALRLARRAVELNSANRGFEWHSLGWAQYRSGDWKGCIESLAKEGGYPRDGDFFAALAHFRLGDAAKAREVFERTDRWLSGYETRWNASIYPNPSMIRRIRAEAAVLLSIEPVLKAANPVAEPAKSASEPDD